MRALVIVAHRLSWPMACGPIPDQGWNLCPCFGGGFLTTAPPGKFYISSFEKCLFKSFAHFLIRLVVFCCFWVNIFCVDFVLVAFFHEPAFCETSK